MTSNKKKLEYNTHETIADRYRDEEGYICNEKDIFPTTVEEQKKLRELFELLKIPIGDELIGHTKIFIATRELDAGEISNLMAGSHSKTDITNRCTSCNRKLPKNHPPTQFECKKCRDKFR